MSLYINMRKCVHFIYLEIALERDAVEVKQKVSMNTITYRGIFSTYNKGRFHFHSKCHYYLFHSHMLYQGSSIVDLKKGPSGQKLILRGEFSVLMR